MLTVETIGRIRREHFLKGKTIKEIARDLKVSRNMVRKVLRSGDTLNTAEYSAAAETGPLDIRPRRAADKQCGQAWPRATDADPDL